jgi:hypothetical protein
MVKINVVGGLGWDIKLRTSVKPFREADGAYIVTEL